MAERWASSPAGTCPVTRLGRVLVLAVAMMGLCVAPSLARADAASDYGAAVLADSPVSYWRLGETSGTTAHDQLGVNEATISGGFTLGQPGPMSGDGSIETTNAYITPGTPESLNPTGAFTIEFWAKVSTAAASNCAGNPSGGICAFYGRGGYGPYIAMESNGTVRETVSGGGSVTSPVSYGDGIWHYYVFSRSATTLSLYVDGQLAAATTASSAANTADPGRYTTIANGECGCQPLVGNIAEVAFYKYALSTAQVAAHWAAANITGSSGGGPGLSLGVSTSAVTKFPGSPTSSGWPGERALFEGTVTPTPGGAAATKWWFKYREVGGLLWIPTKPHPYTGPNIGEESSATWCSPGCSLPGLQPWMVYEVRAVAQEGSGPPVEGNTELFLPGGLINPTSFHPEGGWVFSFFCQSYCQALGGTGIGLGQFVITSFQQQSTGGFGGSGFVSESPGWDQNSGLFYGRMGVGLASLELNHPKPFPGSRQFPYFRFGGSLDYSSSTGLLAIGGPIDNGSGAVVGSWQGCYQSQKCVVSAGSSKAVAGGLSIALGVVGVLATGPVGAAVGICGLVTGAISLDPPSPSYKHVSKPVRLRKIHVRAGKGVSGRSATALSMTGNAMIETSTAGKAFLDAYQRYQGAVAAGSVQWMGRQLTATLNYGKAFAAEIRRAASVLTAQRSALLRSPMATKRLSSRQIVRALQRARRRLSPEVTKKLRQLGLSTTTIRAYLKRLPAKPPAHTTTALAPILNPTFAKELLGFATGLEQYLAKLQKEPLV
jgi:hypothetical protein